MRCIPDEVEKSAKELVMGVGRVYRLGRGSYYILTAHYHEYALVSLMLGITYSGWASTMRGAFGDFPMEDVTYIGHASDVIVVRGGK